MAAAKRIARWRSAAASWLPPPRSPSPDGHPSTGQIDDLPDDEQLKTFDEATLALLNDEVGRRLDGQHTDLTQLDAKAGSLVAASIAASGFLLLGDQTWLTRLAAAAHVVVLLLGLASLAVRTWQQAPTPDVLLRLESTSPNQAYARIVRAKVTAFDRNVDNGAAKADWVKICTWALVLAFVLTVVSKLV
ncbi:hypothetical protein [Blastococcus goldschmidtiae]|uniref:Uncharacterized protein n=1 Tax=Blastococcus goldschmidtiae TaxID=3075546 RepID=A0ABU2K8Y2_9ACTN|nr:hypothetical protein [Blastococcus sp. DSM 46792]MDT0276650.1 hypothetical protein [Blastococcus sp. DSM 46792]